MQNQDLSVLIIEEDEALRAQLIDSFTILGSFHVQAVPDEHTGWIRFQRHQPDCVLLEEHNATRNDFQFARNVRSSPTAVHTLLVLLTITPPGPPPSSQRPLFDLILEKPSSPSVFVRTIANLLKNQASQVLGNGHASNKIAP